MTSLDRKLKDIQGYILVSKSGFYYKWEYVFLSLEYYQLIDLNTFFSLTKRACKFSFLCAFARHFELTCQLYRSTISFEII